MGFKGAAGLVEMIDRWKFQAQGGCDERMETMHFAKAP
jgi:hypothetical protein